MKLKLLVISIFIGFMLPMPGSAAELKTRLTRLEFQDSELLQQFNRRVRLGVSNSLGRLRKQLSLEDEVSNKVDLVYGRVQEILDMQIPRNDLAIVLLPSEAEVQEFYQAEYARQVSYIAYYSPEKNCIYIAVEKADVRVLAHELAHVVIHHFFHKRPPERVHELLAQHVERQFKVSSQKTLK